MFSFSWTGCPTLFMLLVNIAYKEWTMRGTLHKIRKDHEIITLINKVSKVGDRSRGRFKAPFSIATTPRCRGGRYSPSLDCSTLSLIRTLYCWMLSKEVSSTIFKVFGMTRPGIEPWSPGTLTNTPGPMTNPLGQWVRKLHKYDIGKKNPKLFVIYQKA